MQALTQQGLRSHILVETPRRVCMVVHFTHTSPHLRASPLSHHCSASPEDLLGARLGAGTGSLQQPTGVISLMALVVAVRFSRLVQGLSNPTPACLAEPSCGWLHSKSLDGCCHCWLRSSHGFLHLHHRLLHLHKVGCASSSMGTCQAGRDVKQFWCLCVDLLWFSTGPCSAVTPAFPAPSGDTQVQVQV